MQLPNFTQTSHIPAHIAVLGGGISGLVSALRLLQNGQRVTLFEASPELGGLGGTFSHDGHVMEQFYHVMINTDTHLLGLLEELQMTGQIRWQDVGMGFHYGNQCFPFNTPMDLLRFQPLTILERLRTAAGAAYIAKGVRNPESLHHIPVSQWLTKIFGKNVFEKLWRPLLTAKFGEHYGKVPAYWFWSRMTREKSGAKEVKGYVRGGYREIAEQLRRQIENLGGVILLNSPVHSLIETPWDVQVTCGTVNTSFDAVVSTLPMPLLHKIARGKLASNIPNEDLLYMGVVNAVVMLKEQLQPYYWNAIVKPDFAFQGLVETTRVVPAEQTGGRHLVYLLNYCHKDSDTYLRNSADWQAQALKALHELYPGFSADSIEEIKVFKAPYVEPVWPMGYMEKKPQARIPGTKVYLATTAQAYPNVNAWNTMVGIANQTAEFLLSDLAELQARRFAKQQQIRPKAASAVA